MIQGCDDAIVRLFHFSEDPAIEVFTPHVPATNPTQPASVWAIDEHHQSAYWFPRDCPRVTVWIDGFDGEAGRERFHRRYGTDALRLHVVEERWRPAMESTVLHRYELPPGDFDPWVEADGQWIATTPVHPIAVEPFDDLIGRHSDAGVELRFVDDLWMLRDLVVDGGHPFSIIRMMNARRRG